MKVKLYTKDDEYAKERGMAYLSPTPVVYEGNKYPATLPAGQTEKMWDAHVVLTAEEARNIYFALLTTQNTFLDELAKYSVRSRVREYKQDSEDPPCCTNPETHFEDITFAAEQLMKVSKLLYDLTDNFEGDEFTTMRNWLNV